MTDDQLRAIIREAVARHLASGLAPAGAPLAPLPGPPLGMQRSDSLGLQVLPPAGLDPSPSTSTTSAHAAVSIASAPGGIAVAAAPGAVVHLHVSHATFALPGALDGSFDGPCRTEPHAGCTSCGFCQSLGY